MARLAALLPGIVQRSGDIRFGCLQHTGDARSRPGRRLAVLLAVLVFTPATPAHSQEAVAVRAGIHPGFGRLVLEWPAPVKVAAPDPEAVLAVAEQHLRRVRGYLEAERASN